MGLTAVIVCPTAVEVRIEVRVRLRRRKNRGRVGRGNEKRVLTEIRGSKGGGIFSLTGSLVGGVKRFSSSRVPFASTGGSGTLGFVTRAFPGSEKTMSSNSGTSFSTSSRKGKKESTTESTIP